MNTKEHTVTIPIADYNELIEKLNDKSNNDRIERLKAHVELMASQGNVVLKEFNFSKTPIRCIANSDISLGKIFVHFTYHP